MRQPQLGMYPDRMKMFSLIEILSRDLYLSVLRVKKSMRNSICSRSSLYAFIFPHLKFLCCTLQSFFAYDLACIPARALWVRRVYKPSPFNTCSGNLCIIFMANCYNTGLSFVCRNNLCIKIYLCNSTAMAENKDSLS